jgi:hypothetical protein
MRYITGVCQSLLITRSEPIETDEWRAVRRRERFGLKNDKEETFWVVFYVIDKKVVHLFVDDLEQTFDEIQANVFTVQALSANRYSYIIVFADYEDVESFTSEYDRKLWMTCMRKANSYKNSGCTLFSFDKFLDHDAARAKTLLKDHLRIELR